MATIVDVARLARVSRTTVSRVINNSTQVDEATREKVINAIKKLNYQPSIVARSLRKRETKLIAIIIPNIRNPFYGSLVQGMEEVAVRNGYNIILCTTGFEEQREMEYIKMFEQRQIDGMIATTLVNPVDKVKPFTQYGPIVLASGYLEDNPFPTITIDNIEAAKKATNHLISLGHRSIAFINGPEHTLLCRDRMIGYIQSIQENGITVDKDLIQHSEFTIVGGYNCTKNILQLQERPTAIFAANDDMAVGVIKCLKDNGISIPTDIAVVGFDNKQIATVVSPNLTTIEQPIHQMGVEAMNVLLSFLKGESTIEESYRLVLNTRLIIRESSRV